MRDLYKLAGLLCVVTFLSACSGDSFVASANTTSTPGKGSGGTAPGCAADPTAAGCTTTAGYLTIRSSVQEIKSDTKDTAKITATVLDVNRAAIKKVLVTFTAVSASNSSAGQLSSSVAFTDDAGVASVDFTASPDNPANGVVYVRATVTGLSPSTVPVTIKGTILTLTADNTLLIVATGQSNVQQAIKVVAKDAAGQSIANASISFTIAGNALGTSAAPANTALSAAQVTTDVSGLAQVTLTGVSSGDVYLTASGLGTTVQQKLTVQNVALDNPFRITSPVPAAGVTYVPLYANGSTVAVVVNANPSKMTAVGGVYTMRFTTSIGSWTTGSNPGSGYTDVVMTVTSATTGTATATLISNPGDHGFATVYVVDANDTNTYSTLSVAMSPPVADASLVMVQSDINVLPLKTTTVDYEANIQAKVVTNDATGNFPIYQVPVQFTLRNATGGGEVLTKTFGLTDVYGVVKSTLKSGVLSSGASAVTVQAEVLAPTQLTTTLAAADVAVGATTLAASVLTTATNSISVTAIASFPTTTIPPGFVIVVGTEQMLVTAVGSPTTTWTVTRGYNGSTAATHTAGDAVSYFASTSPGNTLSLNPANPNTNLFPASNFVITVDSEKMLVTGKANATTWTVTRGYAGTTPAAHLLAATVTYAPSITDSINVVIGGVGGSVVLGLPTKIDVDDKNTSTYGLSMTAQVADSNGNAVSGSDVTISLWPSAYRTGVWYDTDPDPQSKKCLPYVSGGPYTNEDFDEDLILDRPPVSVVDEDANLDAELTPHNSAAGTAPSKVQTDSKGQGVFTLSYLKQYAPWIDTRARAHTKVQGTETSGTLNFTLLFTQEDADACWMSSSPYYLTLSGALSVSSPQYAIEKLKGQTYVVPLLGGITKATYSKNIDCTLSSSVCTTTGTYKMPSTLPASARSLRALYGAGYSDTTYEYPDDITVQDNSTCTGAVVSNCSVFARFPVRVLVDCSATPGQGGCP